MVAADQAIVVDPSGTSNPPTKGSSDKGKTQVQESGVGSEDPESFAAKYLSIVQSVADPSYTRNLTAFMNARKDKKLLEGVRNALFLLAGMVFQELESLQSLEEELREARTSSEKLRREKDETTAALGAKQAMVLSLEKEKSSMS